MIPIINKILYATDLSKNSAYAFRYAVNSAEKHNAGITILHVLDNLAGTAQTLVSSHLNEVQQDKIFEDNINYTSDWIRERLEVFCKKEFREEHELLNIIDSIEVRGGFPAEEILQTAEDLHCDAIVMGTHGKGSLSHTFLGSVAQKVLRRVRKPVFIIPLPKDEEEFKVDI